MAEPRVCIRCGLTTGYLLDLDTGSVCHREPRVCIELLRDELRAARRPIHDPYLAAVNADRVTELTASELRWRLAAERERERAEGLLKLANSLATTLRDARASWTDGDLTLKAQLMAANARIRELEQQLARPMRVPFDGIQPCLDEPLTSSAVIASLIARLVMLGAVDQTRFAFSSNPPRDMEMHVYRGSSSPVAVRILILPDAEPTS